MIEVFVVRTQDVDSDFGKAVKKLLVSQKFKDAIAKSAYSRGRLQTKSMMSI